MDQRRHCKVCRTRSTGGRNFCSEQCEVTARQIDEAHAGDACRFRALPEAHLPFGWEERVRATVVIGGILFPWGERAVLLRRRGL